MPSPPQPPAVAIVILVEDDTALLQALRFMFLSEGFDAIACETGEALLDLTLPSGRFCLVIDERLPGMSGIAALQTLRERGVTAPAVMITTHPSERLCAAARDALATVIEKPLVGDALAVAVRSVLA